jgi:serine protease
MGRLPPVVRRSRSWPSGSCLGVALSFAVFGIPLSAQPVAVEDRPELVVVLAPPSRAPQAAEVVDQVNARQPLPGNLGFGGPVAARFVLPYRATGETLALLEADPESPRAQIERAVVLTYLQGADLESIRKVLAEAPQIAGAGENGRFPASVVPNDPWFAMKSDPLQYQWGPYLLSLPAAWDRIKGHADIGAIETGVQSNHPDLQAFASTSYKGGPYRPHLSWDFAGNDNNADELQGGLGILGTSAAGHGTHVAGILAGTANNSVGVAGTCWGCSLLVGRNNMSESQVLAALTWLVDHGVQVVNASLGRSSSFVNPCNPPIGFDRAPLCLGLDFAEERSIVVVAASGNARADINFPASDPRVIAVGGIRSTGAFWDDGCFTDNCGSNFTKTAGRKMQDLVAPAKDVVSTVYTGRNWITSPFVCGDGTSFDGYGLCTGTSMSAPFVSGIAGLVRSANPLLSRAQVRQILVETASRGGLWDVQLGYGWPNASAAVNRALGTAAGQVPANRLTPLFSLYSVQGGDHLYTVFPQVAAAALYGFLSEVCNRARPTDFPCSSIPYSTVGPAVAGYPQFPGFPCFGSSCAYTPRSSAYVFVSQTSPYAGAPPLVPLYRMSYNPRRSGGTGPNRDITYTTDPAGLRSFRSVGYEWDGTEGYIYQRCTPEPQCIPPGAVRLYRLYHPARDDYAIFPASELAQKQAEGYISTPGLNDWIGYAYPNLDSDGDQLIDGFETLLGTNPAWVDSDCDGRPDGAEVLTFPYGDPRIGPCGG